MLNNLPVTIHNDVQVMSSVDLAKMCVGDTRHAHNDFFRKAGKVLGESAIRKLSDREYYGNGNSRIVLLLPERESCLMAMSYSYELQAMVYDRWKELETGQAQPAALDYHSEAFKMKALIDAGIMTRKEAMSHFGIVIDEPLIITKQANAKPSRYDFDAVEAELNEFLSNNPDATKHLIEVNRHKIFDSPHSREFLRQVMRKVMF